MKVVKLVSIGLVVSSFVGVLVGCTADSEGDEGDQGSSALGAANGGPSTAAPGNTIMKVDPPAPDPSTGGEPSSSTGGRPTSSTGGANGKPSTAAAANTIMKVNPPAPTPAPASGGAPDASSASKLHCASANQSSAIGADGCPVGEICCQSPVFGHPPICISGNYCPKLP